jgi:hypothetical protein
MATRRAFPIAAILLLLAILFWTGHVGGQSRTASAVAKYSPTTTGPAIGSVPGVIDVADNFVISGTGFDSDSLVNFFVATSTGAINYGPLVPWSILSNSLSIFVPVAVNQGEGVVSLEVVNTDEVAFVSNTAYALLQGNPADGFPSLVAINGNGLSPTSLNPGIALANVETVVVPGSTLTLSGRGFDTDNGVAVDVFCGCPGGKAGPYYLAHGTAGLSSTALSLTLPSGATGPATGPGSIRVTNLGDYFASASVSVPIGARISINSVTQSGATVTVKGTGFSNLTVINLFNNQGGSVVNLGGLDSSGKANIVITFVSDTQLTFTLPAGVSGAAYVQALNPPFIPFTSSGNSPGGAFTAN